MNGFKRLATTVLAAGAVGMSGLALGAGIAQADAGPYTWCPGDSMDPQPPGSEFNGPGKGVIWDMTTCHTWWRLSGPPGRSNVADRYPVDPWTWVGDQPPDFHDDHPTCALFICQPG